MANKWKWNQIEFGEWKICGTSAQRIQINCQCGIVIVIVFPLKIWESRSMEFRMDYATRGDVASGNRLVLYVQIDITWANDRRCQQQPLMFQTQLDDAVSMQSHTTTYTFLLTFRLN